MFQFGDKVKIKNEFYNNSIGIVLQYKKLDHWSALGDRAAYSYLIRISHPETIYTEAWIYELDLEKL